MSDPPAAPLPAAHDPVANPRDFLPRVQTVRTPHLPPAPWPGLTRAECLLWAMALHRAAVAARLSAGEDW
jgi:hypothetical protein